MKSYLYDYVVVGAGFAGSVFAREAADKGKKVLVIDRRPHVAGNVYTERKHGIDVHKYGPHIFHTKNERVWRWINQQGRFNNYRHVGKVKHQDTVYSFPINLMTLQQVFRVTTPAEALAQLSHSRVPCLDPQTLEEWALASVGEELYRIFIEGYTTKQWGTSPKNLPKSIIQRIPVRLTFDDNYFHNTERYQGIPEDGYTALFEKMLEGIEVRLGVDFLKDRAELCALAPSIIYTGPVDELLDYKYGKLGYRSLRFEEEEMEGDFQGCSIMNYGEESIPFTRIVEHKHFQMKENPHTIITREYPIPYTEGETPYYPLADKENLERYDLYDKEAKSLGFFLIGRLATYKYLDMDMVIGQALVFADRILTG